MNYYEIWHQIMKTWMELAFEITALRECRNNDLKRLELVERALREDGKL